MNLQLISYLIAMAVTLLAVAGFGWAWWSYHRLARDLADREARLPDATRLPGLREEVERSENELKQLRDALSQAQLVIGDKQKAEQWLADNEAVYEQARRSLPLLVAQADEKTKQIELLTQEFDEIHTEVSEGKHQREWLRQDERRLGELVELQKTELERARNAVDALQTREAGLQATFEELRARLDAREQELREIQAELPLARRQLEEVYERVTQVTAEHERRKREIEEFKIEHQNLVKLLEAAEKRWTQLAPAAGGSEEHRLAELWDPVLSGAYFTGTQVGGEQDCLEGTEQYLEKLGLHFPARVIRAFHTSLKVADVSPLVVLAGISGTGKSELPRRYAEAMGMHFLNIPVQPRWDSPQDMFGFYNYMENRYRATELARALVQMDPFFNEQRRGWNAPSGWEKNSLSQQLLLVLLDEMNLARVEYYFSEFLSRLETRRGVDKSNSVQRRKAEISLEVGLRSLAKGNIGTGKGHEATMQVFVDRNVLFVGTMNEDETTQTLSDKVVDRANVLRFGRPAQFPSRNGREPVSPAPNALRFDRWTSWMKADSSLPADVSDATNRWIDQLNVAMQLIRRPFAHRTHLAMRSFLANYPDPDAYRDAMADQVELKILPKFRGLDPQENVTRQALQTVREVLEELEDQPLIEALDQCLQQGEHQFMWQGLDRTAEAQV